MCKLFKCLLVHICCVFIASSAVAAAFDDLKVQVENYKLRYGLKNLDAKLVDNHGNGFEPLYGIRNFRTVLYGVYYRGGANNKYHRTTPRNNMNPLPNDGLKNLCEEGFKEAVYLYTNNYAKAPKVTSCVMADGSQNRLSYFQTTALDTKNNEIHLGRIFDHIKMKVQGPIYEHCWNGWHSSGYVAAIALKQFCGLNNAEADSYWVRNTDGNEKGMSSIREKIKSFKPLAKFSITNEERNLLCP